MARPQMTDVSWVDIAFLYPSLAEILRNEFRLNAGSLPFDYGFVYMIWAKGTHIYKVGKSIHPDKRILQISPTSPYELEIVCAIHTPFMGKGERYVHDILSEYRMNGEWFKIPPTDDFLKWAKPFQNAVHNAYWSEICDKYVSTDSSEWKSFFRANEWLLPEFLSFESVGWLQYVFSEMASKESSDFYESHNSAVLKLEERHQ